MTALDGLGNFNVVGKDVTGRPPNHRRQRVVFIHYFYGSVYHVFFTDTYTGSGEFG